MQIVIAVAVVAGVAWFVLNLQDSAQKKADPDGGVAGMLWFIVLIALGGVLIALASWASDVGWILSR